MKQKKRQFTLEYIVSHRTDGANAFAVFESLTAGHINPDALRWTIVKIPYHAFLKTAYWFAVSTVAKSRAGMRCQVCNSGQKIQVHHRTYDTHGAEHLNMYDLVVLCDNCHGLFHGHKVIEYRPPALPRGLRVKPRTVPKVITHDPKDVQMPEGDPIELTYELIQQCRTHQRAFTNATLRAFGLCKPLIAGWPSRLIGTKLPRERYRQALEGKFHYNSGPLEYERKQPDVLRLIAEQSATDNMETNL